MPVMSKLEKELHDRVSGKLVFPNRNGVALTNGNFSLGDVVTVTINSTVGRYEFVSGSLVADTDAAFSVSGGILVRVDVRSPKYTTSEIQQFATGGGADGQVYYDTDCDGLFFISGSTAVRLGVPNAEVMDTDMSNLDDNIENTAQKLIGSRLNAPIFDTTYNALDIKANSVRMDNSGTLSFYSEHKNNQSINWPYEGSISIGVEAGQKLEFGFGGSVKQSMTETALDMNSSKITNVTAGDAGTDAINLEQLDDAINGILIPDTYTGVRIYDDTKDPEIGYGDATGKITYFPITTGVVMAPNATTSKYYFTHETTGTTRGFMFIHQSAFVQAGFDVTGVLSVAMLPKYVVFQLGGSNKNKPVGGVWNAEGLGVPDGEPINAVPSKYLTADGESTTTIKSEALNACYSHGKSAIVSGNIVAQRGGCVSSAQYGPTSFVADSSSEWFVIQGITAGAGTFGEKKLMELFCWNAFDDDAVFNCTEDVSSAIGLMLKYSYGASSDYLEFKESGIMDTRLANTVSDLTAAEQQAFIAKLGETTAETVIQRDIIFDTPLFIQNLSITSGD